MREKNFAAGAVLPGRRGHDIRPAMIRRVRPSPPPETEACRRWYAAALAAHAAFADGEMAEPEYRRRLLALGCGRAEVDDEVALRRQLRRTAWSRN